MPRSWTASYVGIFQDETLLTSYWAAASKPAGFPAIAAARRATCREEILRRGLLTEDQLAMVEQGKLRIGGPIAMMYAAMGPPVRSSWTYTRSGKRGFHVYSDSRSVSTDDGAISVVRFD